LSSINLGRKWKESLYRRVFETASTEDSRV
jgi:hypothetical protein